MPHGPHRSHPRGVRSTEQSWMELHDRLEDTEEPIDIQMLIERVKQNNWGDRRTLLRGENFWFLRLGEVIERADNTARLLDVKYHTLLPEGEDVGGAWTSAVTAVL